MENLKSKIIWITKKREDSVYRPTLAFTKGIYLVAVRCCKINFFLMFCCNSPREQRLVHVVFLPLCVWGSRLGPSSVETTPEKR